MSPKKEIKEDIRRWQDLSCSCISRINIVKMAVIPKSIYIFNNLYQNFNDILHRDGKINPKVHVGTKRPQIVKVIWDSNVQVS
jgi:hypothetical protein